MSKVGEDSASLGIFSRVPYEIRWEILFCLDPDEIQSFRSVSREFREMVDENRFWRIYVMMQIEKKKISKSDAEQLKYNFGEFGSNFGSKEVTNKFKEFKFAKFLSKKKHDFELKPVKKWTLVDLWMCVKSLKLTNVGRELFSFVKDQLVKNPEKSRKIFMPPSNSVTLEQLNQEHSVGDLNFLCRIVNLLLKGECYKEITIVLHILHCLKNDEILDGSSWNIIKRRGKANRLFRMLVINNKRPRSNVLSSDYYYELLYILSRKNYERRLLKWYDEIDDLTVHIFIRVKNERRMEFRRFLSNIQKTPPHITMQAGDKLRKE